MKKEHKVLREVFEWTLCVVIAIVIALILKHYVVTPTIVKQTSMYPTLIENEKLILNKAINKKKLKSGDIITFEAPSKLEYTPEEVDLNNPVAKYENNPKGIFNEFTYYVLEVGKGSFIKRVIGVAGDHIVIKDGKVYVNDKILDESYLQDTVITQEGNFNDIIVPEGYVFALGDNREASRDSRIFGCIPLEKIESKVLVRVWPLNKMGEV